MKHPADEFMEDFAANRFHGERAFDPLGREPFRSSSPWQRGWLPLGLLWDTPWLRASDGDEAGQGNARPSGFLLGLGFWPLAVGMLVGGLIGHRLGGPPLMALGILVGLRLGGGRIVGGS